MAAPARAAAAAEDPADDDENNAAPMNQFQMDPEQFKMFVYQQIGGSLEAYDQKIRRSIRMRIDQVDRIAKLTPEQWEKMHAAIDIEAELQTGKINTLVAQMQQAKNAKDQNDLIQRAAALNQERARPLGGAPNAKKPEKSSLWNKVLNSILTSEQEKLIETDAQRRIKQAREARLFHFLLQFQRKLGLNHEQRQKLLQMLEASENGPPNSFEETVAKVREQPKDWLESVLTREQLETLQKPLTATVQMLDADMMFGDPFE